MLYNPHKKIALALLGLTFILLASTAIFFFSKEGKMFILVNPRPEKSLLEKTVRIPQDLQGEILEINLEEEKIFSPKASLEVESVVRGEVEIINTTNQNFNFVKTTRLLTPDNILFRLEQQTSIPAKGRVKAKVYADKTGAASEIGPSRFTFPGLSSSLQSQIYAESKEKMQGGARKIGLVTDNDLEEAKKNIEEIINEKAEKSIQDQVKEKKLALTDWKIVLGDKNLTIDSDVKAGEERGEFTLKGKLKIALVIINEKELLELTKKLAQQSIPKDKGLKDIESNTLTYEVKKINLTNKVSDLGIKIKISTIIKENSSIFDFAKIKTMGSKEIKAFLEQYKEIEEVRIKFDPFWDTKTPQKDGLIIIKIKE